MLEIIQSITIGAIQGITEFLPISSSGHLVLVPYLLNWDYQGLSFDVALHFGTVLAIIAYFWKDWITIITKAIIKSEIRNPKSEINSNEQNSKSPELPTPNSQLPTNLLWQILVASIPAAIIGYFIKDIVESTLQSPILLAINLIFFGLLLWIADKYFISRYKIPFDSAQGKQDFGYKHSFIIGMAQAIALVPGVSRSGITMTAGRMIGLDRPSSARFSFLLGTPAMIGAFLFTARDLSINNLNLAFILAVITSTLFGFVAIKYLLKYLVNNNFSIFAWYRIVLAIIVLMVFFLR